MRIYNNRGRAGRIRAARIAVLLVFLLSASSLFSANITVPTFEIYSWARNEGSGFQLDSYGDIDVQLDGGFKFAGSLMFGFQSDGLETALYDDMLYFKAASITLRQLFNIPLNFTYFIGQGDTLASGELFQQQFGTPPIESLYTDFVRFPNAGDFDFYRGIHTVYGTGAKFEYAPIEQNWLVALYIYQDSAPAFITAGPPATLEYGHASLDVRTAFNWEKLRLEAFLGATYPTSDSDLGYYRTGVLMHVGINDVEFLTEIGIPLYKPREDPFSIDLFYLMVEQRVRLGALSEVLTVLWRPSYYQQDANTDTGLDINLDIAFGGKDEKVLAGGVGGNFAYLAASDEITGKIVPYLQVATSGVVFEVRASTKVYPFDMDFSDLLEVFISMKASF